MNPNNFTASPTNTLTLDILDDLKKTLNLRPLPRDEFFVNPVVMEAFKKESRQGPNLITTMMGMPIFLMENQKADCWVISDPHLAKAYRSGTISEEELKRMNDKRHQILEISESQEKK